LILNDQLKNIKLKTIKLKFLLICILGLLSGIHLTYATPGSSAGDPYPAFEIPVFQGGYNIKKDFNPAGGSKTVTYSIQLKSPAAEIIEFYDSYFNGKGWISSFEICQRHWDAPADQTINDAPPVKQMFASWEHPDLDLKVVLWLKHDLANKQGQNDVKVECRLQTKTSK
jgi:hypothetical protein